MSDQKVRVRNGSLSPDKVEKMEQLLGKHWVGKKKQNKNWFQRYEDLKKHYAKYGHCYVREREYGVGFSSWVRNQRKKYQKKELNHEQIRLLDALHFYKSIVEESSDKYKT